MSEMYWNKIINEETVLFMKGIADKEVGEGEDGEDLGMIQKFVKHIKERTDYKSIVMLATQWSKYEAKHQADLAVQLAGMYHASRFIILMDYLSYRFAKGDLK